MCLLYYGIFLYFSAWFWRLICKGCYRYFTLFISADWLKLFYFEEVALILNSYLDSFLNKLNYLWEEALTKIYSLQSKCKISYSHYSHLARRGLVNDFNGLLLCQKVQKGNSSHYSQCRLSFCQSSSWSKVYLLSEKEHPA